MAIILPSGFQITNSDPVDSRISVANASARLGFSAANVYEGLIVYQRDTNETYVLIDTSLYNSSSGWQLLGSGTVVTGSFAVTGSNTFNGSQIINGNLQVTGSIFGANNTLFISGNLLPDAPYNSYYTSSFNLGSPTAFWKNLYVTSIQVTGSATITGTNGDIFLIKNSSNRTIFSVSQSGVVNIASQSADPTGLANVGDIWFTSTDFYVGLT
jgi:hypothetical protein